MAGNTEKIDELVDPAAPKQITDLKKYLEDLESQFVDTAKAAISFNNATANSKTPAEFKKTVAESDKATKSLLDNQEKIRLGEIKLQQAREKAFDDYEKKLAKQQAIEDKAAAKRSLQAQKEIENSKKQQAQADKEAKAFESASEKKNSSLAKQNRAFEILNKQYQEAIKNAKDIGAAQGTTSQAFLDATDHANKLGKQVDSINTPLGDFKNKVGQYTKGIADYFGAAFSKIRLLANILPNFGIGTFFLVVGTAIATAASNFKVFQSALDETTVRQIALNAALEDADYKKGIDDIVSLTNEIKLAKGGILDQTEVLGKYNATLGLTFGQVTSLDEAEQKLVANSDNYVKSLFYKAAAAAVLAQGTEELIKAAEEQRKAEEGLAQASKEAADLKALAAKGGNDAAIAESFGLKKAAANQQRIYNEDIKEAKAHRDQAVKITSGLYKNLTQLSEQFAANFTQDHKYQEESTNRAITYNKMVLQNSVDKNNDIYNDDKKSYSARYAALKRSTADQVQILQLSATAELNTTKLTAEEQKAIVDKNNFDILKVREDYVKKKMALDDKASAQDIAHIKNNLQKEKDASKLIIDSPGSSLDTRLEALETYNTKSKALINIQYKEEKKAAGENAKSIVLAKDNQNKALLELQIDYNSQQSKILETEYNSQISNAKKHDTNLYNLIKTSTQQNIQQVAEGAKAQIDKLDAAYEKSGGSYELYQAKREAIQKEASDTILQINIDEANKLIALKTKGGLDASAEEKQLADLEIKQFQDKERRKTEALRKESDLRKQLQAKEYELAQEVLKGIQQVVDQNYENQIQTIQSQSDVVTQSANDQKKAIDGSLQSNAEKQRKDAIIDAKASQSKKQLAQQQNEIRHKEAVFNRDAAALNVVVSTAEAVGKIELQAAILAADPFTAFLAPLALAQVPIALALGAVQEAAIFAAPLPKYRTGGTVKRDGPIITGEGGSELKIDPTGEFSLTPGYANVSYAKAGTKIINHEETIRLLGKPEKLNYTGGQEISMNEVSQLLKENNRLQKLIAGKSNKTVVNGWYREQLAAQSWQAYENKFRR